MKVIFNVFRIMTACLILVSFNSVSSPITHVSEPPYGHWWLLNPQASQPNLIAGGLMVCKQDEKASCGDEEVMLVLLERNTGHGCTDYVGTGKVKQNPDSRQWQIFIDEDGKPALWATATKTGNNLVLKLSGSNKELNLKRANPEDIDKNAENACDQSLKDYLNSNRSSR
ncbi:hypothetical protein [Endozoicomonas sp. 4G]|uniref:hypothetical protein n=1 Tax=Endozoicomonas sp. 4G TaxID=2872754 RepID=UPI00207870E1|nr:hypothetical protein [Endozoicomonas sp. 4G]